MHSAALVGLDGSIDWCCMPRIDSPSVFAAILDDERGGSFQIAPLGLYESTQRYLPETNILETTFVTATGVVTLTDFMPLAVGARRRRPAAGHPPHRRVRRGLGCHAAPSSALASTTPAPSRAWS